MVGVGQLHLASNILQIKGGQGPLDGPLGAYIHKNRRLYGAMGAGKDTPAGLTLGLDYFKHSKTPLSCKCLLSYQNCGQSTRDSRLLREKTDRLTETIRFGYDTLSIVCLTTDSMISPVIAPGT